MKIVGWGWLDVGVAVVGPDVSLNTVAGAETLYIYIK